MGGKYRGSKGKRSAGSAQDGVKAPLSMADEARNTERHFLRRSGLRLRDNGIKFVSAGDMKPDDPAMLNEFNDLDIQENTAEGIEPLEAEGAAAVHGTHQDAPITSAETVESVEHASTNERGENQLPGYRSLDPLFFYDVEGDPVLRRVERLNPDVRCDTPALTDSSDDEVIFKGRGALKPAIAIEDPIPECPSSRGVKEAEIPRCVSPDNQNTYAQISGVWDFEKDAGTFSPVSSKAFLSLEGTTRTSKRASKRRRFPHEQEDDEVLADYIENIMNQPSSSEDGAVSDDPGEQPSTVIHTAFAGLDAPVLLDQDPFLSGDFIDRALLSGTGLASSSNEPGDMEMDELDGSDLNDNSSAGDELDQEIDPKPSKYKPGTGVTVFAENLDFSDIMDADDDGMDYSTVTRKSRRRNRGSTRRTNFPSASAFADALDEDPYGAFDIMDFDRPSLRKKPKGKRNIPEFGLSDSEMEWQLQVTWENDRKKKKIKKQQREELRAQGLLGNKARKSGTNSGGMKAEDIVSHVRAFLLSDNERLSLPPMDKTWRKFVHEMASTLSLGSISKGQGAARFPILTKTTRTPDYDSDSIDRFDRLISRNRFLRRIEKSQGYRKNTGGESTSARARGGTKAASYIDGDVVGASAPEIGIENKGRVMLEKMGWTTGTALGAIHNKGILQPVAHVVKTSRAGLG